jgi:hypothetical protein
MSTPVPCAASTLLAGLLDDSEALDLAEVVRTPVSVHYETGRDDVPVLCLCTPTAVRLPNAAVVAALPTATPLRLHVTRWWRPRRPHGLTASTRPLDLDPSTLLGAGPGLTPSGDDVLAGALVAAHAVGHPGLAALRAATRDALRVRRTTAVSRGLLTHALDGWSTPELADYLEAFCRGEEEPARQRLLRVGHSSGAALLDGVHLVVDADAGRRAA